LPWPYTQSDAISFITEVAATQPMTYAVCRDGALVGAVSLDGQLGYWLLPTAWGKGFATEASRTLIALHFGKNADAVPSSHRPENARSRNVLARLGFEDASKREVFSNLEQTNVTLQDMVLTANAWRAVA
jgi:RimJ/RimL family protein N-acetyltransferase